MWIIVPLTFCHCVPVSADTTSASEWRSQMLEQSVLSRSKPLRAKSWQRAWKTKPWMKRLFGRICDPLTATRDKIRTLRFGGSYDFRDKFLGLNVVSLSLSQGVDGFGASDANNPFSSRSDAKPDFTKLEVGYNRQDFISKSLLFNLDLKGQLSPDGLYSSEEFGFGGINAGRAYDFSEITGDQGFSALAEIQYTGLDRFYNYQVHPFVFYDFGKVWNKGDAAIKNISASSAGVGARVYGDNGLNFDASLAFPLTKSIDNPLYGNGKNPVLRFGMTYQF